MIATAPVRKPRRRPAPSLRDQQLYVEYQTTGVTQVELAEKYKLTQCRISQIIRRVAAWRGGIDPSGRPLPAGQLTPHEQQRLDRWLERERNEALIKAAFRKFDQPQITTTTKTDAAGQVQQTTVREQPPNVQYLKVAQRANEQLFRREQLEPVPLKDADEKERQRLVFAELVKFREAAQAAGRVKAKSYPVMFVAALLRAVQGEPPHCCDDDPGLEELAERLYWKREDDEEIRQLEEKYGLPPSKPVPSRDHTWSRSERAEAAPQAESAVPPESVGWDEAAEVPPETNSSTSAEWEDSPQVEWAAADASDQSAEENPGGGGCGRRSCPQPGRERALQATVRRGSPDPAETTVRRGSPDPAETADRRSQSAGETCGPRSGSVGRPATTPVVRSCEPQPPDAAERRRLHMQKLEQLKEARRRGLPIMFEFDPADGPLPPNYVMLDGEDYP